MTTEHPDDMTPTEELALEVLAARHRLGEQLWTFRSQAKPALDRLARRGLVTVMPGITERTVRATLTATGKSGALSPTYVPPLLQERTVDRLEHLEVLPDFTVVVDHLGLAWQLFESVEGLRWYSTIAASGAGEAGFQASTHAELMARRGPVTIVHIPAVAV